MPAWCLIFILYLYVNLWAFLFTDIFQISFSEIDIPEWLRKIDLYFKNLLQEL